jgi:cytidylate kinase
MSGPVVLLSGPPRSGKSTIARKIAEAYGLTYLSPGDLLKEQASSENRPLNEYFSLLTDDVIKEIIDTGIKLIEEGNYVIAGRYEPLACRQAGMFVPAIYIDAPFDVRARREAEAESITFKEAAKRLREREAAEKELCRRLFGRCDYEDPKLFIGTVDTADLSPEKAYDAVVRLLSEKGYLVRTAERLTS